MAGVIKPKPGVYRGVHYRSQLEIAWAKYLDSLGTAVRTHQWSYVDRHDCDFIIHSKNRGIDEQVEYFGEMTCCQCRVEVKPNVPELCISALERIAWDNMLPCESWVLVIGNPPNAYGAPVCVHFDFMTTLQWGMPFPEKTAYITIGHIHENCDVLNNRLLAPAADAGLLSGMLVGQYEWEENDWLIPSNLVHAARGLLIDEA